MDNKLMEIIQRAHKTVLPGRDALASEQSLLPGAGEMDSREFVSFIVTVEELLENEFQQPFVLLDEAAFSGTASPFRNIQSFAEFISAQLSPS